MSSYHARRLASCFIRLPYSIKSSESICSCSEFVQVHARSFISSQSLVTSHASQQHWHQRYLLLLVASGSFVSLSALCKSAYADAVPDAAKEPVEVPWQASEELAKEIEQRLARKQAHEEYIQTMQRKVHAKIEPGITFTLVKWHKVMKEADATYQDYIISHFYRSPNNYAAERAFVARYGDAAWTDEALTTAVKYGPLLLIGALNCAWGPALKNAGAEVVGVDGMFDEKEVLARHPKKTLLLLFPDRTDLAVRLLAEYKRDVLIYVGEARGGEHADDAFFDALEKDWVCTQAVGLTTFWTQPIGFEKMWILKRKNSKKSWNRWLMPWRK